MTAASDSRYPVITHWTCAIELCRSCRSVCSATLTIVVSRIDMIIPRMTTPAIFHTYGSIRSDASGWKPGSGAVVGEEDIRYLNVRYQTFLLQGLLVEHCDHGRGMPGSSASSQAGAVLVCATPALMD